jgi:hypothetical protein
VVRAIGTVVGLLVLGGACFFGVRSLVADEPVRGQQAARPIRTSADPPATPTASIPPATRTSPARRVQECRTTPVSSGLARLEPVVVALHDAACRGDYEALLPHMSDPFGSPLLPKEAAIGVWPARIPDGDPLAVLAETLETPVHGDQGGQFFCHPDGAIAVFARPIGEQPQLLSDFDPTGQTLPNMCG